MNQNEYDNTETLDTQVLDMESRNTQIPDTQTSDAAIRKKKVIRNWIIVLIILIIAVPIGILNVPGWNATVDAYGESDLSGLVGSQYQMPSWVADLTSFWNSPLNGYGGNFPNVTVGYWISAIVGVALIMAAVWILGRILTKRSAQSNAVAKLDA